MKVLLLQDVKDTGKKGQIVDVSDGYARNFLFARKMGKIATAENINAANQAEAAAVHKKKVEASDAKKLAASINGKSFVLKAKCGENGKLFGAITSKEIAEEVNKQLGTSLDKKNVEIDGNIKILGEYDVVLRVYAETTAKIKLSIVAE